MDEVDDGGEDEAEGEEEEEEVEAGEGEAIVVGFLLYVFFYSVITVSYFSLFFPFVA